MSDSARSRRAMTLPIAVGVVLITLMVTVGLFGGDSIWFGALAFSAQVLAVVVVAYAATRLVRGAGRILGRTRPGSAFKEVVISSRFAVAASPVGRGGQAVSTAARRLSSPAYLALLVFYVATVGVWLLVGLLPTIASWIPVVHDGLHDITGSGAFAEVAHNAASSSHGVEGVLDVLFDYVFSAVNISLGLFLVWQCGFNRAARLLALAMIGSAVAFNLTGHQARAVFASDWRGVVETWHTSVHLIAGVTYVFALLVFPDGRLPTRWRATYVLFVTLIASQLAAMTAADHIVGLLLVFGLMTPVVGLASQARRFHRASTPQERQQSKILLGALGAAFATAVLLIGGTVTFTSTNEALAQTTKTYELEPLEEGRYYFRCDPHPDMEGVLVAEGTGTSGAGDQSVAIEVAAEEFEFDQERIVVPADRSIILNFTNKDADAHNVAIYGGTGGLSRSEFVGDLFSGQDVATLSFRVFRILFLLIPIALFVGILRFHLWDVDHILNRALVYGSLTGALGLFYLASVVLLQRLLGPLIQGSDIAIAGSTLATASAFRPARSRIQEFIDRRFYRRRYDAVQALERFTERMRRHEQIDLENLEGELMNAVGETMQPAHAALWLRPSKEAAAR